MKNFEKLPQIEQYKVKNHISNLVNLCTIDGKFSKSEYEIMLSICDRYGLPKSEFVDIIKGNFASEYIIPSDTYEKLEQLYDFVRVTLADHKIETGELEVCKHVAMTLQIKKEAINSLIMSMIEYINAGSTFDSVKMHLYAQTV
ncbi:MAG: hypothetical protein NW207_00315 [Cytophagales bacterium]|nr:hypothetical protein [Cytophagales bacterium]